MANIKRKSHFDEKVLTQEQLEAGIIRNADGSESDDLEINHGNVTDASFAQPAMGVMSKGALLEQLELDESVISGVDAKAYERESTAPVYASPVVMTEEVESKVLAAGMISTALETPSALSHAKVATNHRRDLAAALQDITREIPTPDAVTVIDNRRVILPAEVRETPNKLDKKLQMRILELMVGEKLTLKVAKCARQAGVCFHQKPCMWLSQRLGQELGKRRIWAKLDIPADDQFDDLDEKQEQQFYQATAKLFSYHIADQLQQICDTRHVSMQTCLLHVIDRVCEIAIDERAPKDYVEKYDNLETLEQALGRLG